MYWFGERLGLRVYEREMLAALIIIVFVVGICMILPIYILSKWKQRPFLAFLISVALTCLSFVLVFEFLSGVVLRDDYLNWTRMLGLAIIALMFCLPILTLIQWMNLRKRKRLTKSDVKDIF